MEEIKYLLKNIVFGVVTIIYVGVVLVATSSWVEVAQGKTFHEIVTNINLVFRFFMSIVTFVALLVIYIEYIIIRFLD